jgi:hypothetical protein
MKPEIFVNAHIQCTNRLAKCAVKGWETDGKSVLDGSLRWFSEISRLTFDGTSATKGEVG